MPVKTTVKKIVIPIAGNVIGYQYDDETTEAAMSRILLEGEMHGNDGKSRLHLSVIVNFEERIRQAILSYPNSREPSGMLAHYIAEELKKC